MSASPVPESAAPASKPEKPSKDQNAAAQPPSRWQKYVTPLLVVLLALMISEGFVRISSLRLSGLIH